MHSCMQTVWPFLRCTTLLHLNRLSVPLLRSSKFLSPFRQLQFLLLMPLVILGMRIIRILSYCSAASFYPFLCFHSFFLITFRRVSSIKFQKHTPNSMQWIEASEAWVVNCANSHSNCHDKKWISDEWSSDIILERDQSRYGIFLANEYLNPNDIASSKNNSARQTHAGIYLNSTTSALPVLHRNAQRIVVSPPSSASTAHCHARSSSHLQIRLSPSPILFRFPSKLVQPFPFLCVAAAPQSLFTSPSRCLLHFRIRRSFQVEHIWTRPICLLRPALAITSSIEYFLFSFWHS